MNQSLFSKGYLYSIYALCFSICFLYIFQSICIGALIFFWLLSGQYKNLIKNLRKNKYVFTWIIFYILYAISFFYSANKNEALTGLSYKSSFLLFPILIGGGTSLTWHNINKAFRFFIAGIIFTFAYCLVFAYFSLYQKLGIDAFFYDNLTHGLESNAVFTSWKCFFALTIIMFYRLPEKRTRQINILDFIRVSLIFLFFILLCSKTLIVIFLGLIMMIATYHFINSRGKWKLKFFIVFFSLLTTYALFSFKDSPLKRRYEDAANAFNIRGSNKQFDVQFVDNFNKRATLWKAAWTNIKADNNWIWGCGVGDTQDLMDKTLCDPDFHYKGFYNICSLKGLYVHNMYLQVLITVGILGLLTLISIIWFGIASAALNKNYIIMSFYLLLAFFMLQESVLQVQSGIVYSCFFSCIFTNYLASKA